MIFISLFDLQNWFNFSVKGADLDKLLLGKQIKQLRIERGLSQEKLSEMIYISPRQMCLIENGNSYPSLDTFIRIAEVLEIDVNEFFKIRAKENDEYRNSIIDLIKGLDRRKLPLVKDILIAVDIH